MGLKDMLEKAVKVSADIKFMVQFNLNGYMKEEATEMNYLELGTYLVSNAQKIDYVIICLGD